MQKITKRTDGSIRVQLICEDPGRTKQSSKKECDINYIMAQFQKNKKLPDLITKIAQYGDVSNIPDYRDAVEIVMRGQETFDMLPAMLKTRFNQDPAQFLDFVLNPDNKAEMVKLGLAEKPAKTDPGVAVPPVPAAPGSPQGGA